MSRVARFLFTCTRCGTTGSYRAGRWWAVGQAVFCHPCKPATATKVADPHRAARERAAPQED